MTTERENLPRLTCSICENLLSIYPIYAYKTQNTFVFICGRCPLNREETLHRQIAYESSVQDKLFPCRYSTEGCARKLCPEDLLGHEKYCESRSCVCPSFPFKLCNWAGKCSELHDHYTSEHASLVLNDGNDVELEVKRGIVNNYLWPSNGDLFLIYLRNSRSSVLISYHLIYLMSSRSYQIEYNECEKVYPTSIEDFQELNFKPKVKMIKQQNQTYVVKIRKVTDATVKEQIEIPKLPQMHEDMLKRMQCPICAEFMRPPITNCSTGHSFCLSCAVETTECPTCQEPTPWGRNFALEDILRVIIYPCRSRKFGCPVAQCLKEIEIHEQNDCLFKYLTCPFDKCSWQNRQTKFVEHVLNDHQAYYIKGKPLVFPVSSPQYHQGIIDYDENIFYVEHRYDGIFYSCSAGLVGPGRNSDDYEFEFQMRDPDKDRETLVLRRKCVLGKEFRLFDYFASTATIALNKYCVDEVQLYVQIIKKCHLDLI